MKAAQRQFLVKVSGIDGYFTTKSGGNVSAETNKHYDGGSLKPDVIASPAEAENITCGRAYDSTRDPALLKRLRQQVGRLRTTVSVTPTNEDLVAIAEPVVYSDAILVGLTEPDVDAGGADVATWEVEFAIGDYN